MRCLFVFAIVLLFHHWETLAYKAAVVEYHPTNGTTADNTIRKNLDEYRRHIDKARKEGCDIIVFPEYGLTTVVDDPIAYAIDFTDNSTNIIQEVRAMATANQIYIVINLLEKVQEANKTTMYEYYNTNLVFGKNGTIVFKYRKINLFAEPKLTKGADNQVTHFKTDFGVTFGIFTCFDILFNNPSRTVLKNSEVTDVIFPTAWFSTLPFYSSLTFQHGYALATGVNLLAANYDHPQDSNGGSGIYLADGITANTSIADSDSTKLITLEVPTTNTRPPKNICSATDPQTLPGDLVTSNVSHYVTKRKFNASEYTFKNINMTQKQVTTEVCNNGFCCTFDITINTTQTTTNIYKVMAFDGIEYHDQTKAHIRVCSLLACHNDSNDSCGERVDTTAKFTKITVKGNLKTDDDTFYMPLTLDSNLLPLRPSAYCDTNNGTGTTFVQLTTLQATQDVLVFGIFGRTESTGGSAAIYGTIWLLVLVVVKSLVF